MTKAIAAVNRGPRKDSLRDWTSARNEDPSSMSLSLLVLAYSAFRAGCSSSFFSMFDKFLSPCADIQKDNMGDQARSLLTSKVGPSINRAGSLLLRQLFLQGRMTSSEYRSSPMPCPKEIAEY